MVLLRFFGRDFLRPLVWLTVALAASIGALPNAPAQDVPEALDPAEARRLAPIDPFPATLTPTVAPIPYDRTEAERFRILRRSLAPEPLSEKDLVVRPLEGYIDWDQVEDVIYSPGRTRVQQGNFILEADKLIIDNRLGEIQAEGNVIMRTVGGANTYGSDNEIHADALRYNFAEGEGIATNIRGFYPPMYFKTERAGGDDDEEPSPMRMVSAEESLFRNTSVTACNFVVPHYRIRAREIILFANDRVFFRGATVFVG